MNKQDYDTLFKLRDLIDELAISLSDARDDVVRTIENADDLAGTLETAENNPVYQSLEKGFVALDDVITDLDTVLNTLGTAQAVFQGAAQQRWGDTEAKSYRLRKDRHQ